MENENYELTPAKYLKINTVIHLALISGVALFSVIAFGLIESRELRWNDTGDIFFFIVPIAAILGIVAGNILYKKGLESLIDKNTLKEKLTGFQTALIIKYAFLEGPSLIGVVAFFNTGNLLYLLISGVLIIYFFFQRPSKEKIMNDLELSGALKDQFNEQDKAVQ
jgi:MFS family permease